MLHRSRVQLASDDAAGAVADIAAVGLADADANTLTVAIAFADAVANDRAVNVADGLADAHTVAGSRLSFDVQFQRRC